MIDYMATDTHGGSASLTYTVLVNRNGVLANAVVGSQGEVKLSGEAGWKHAAKKLSGHFTIQNSAAGQKLNSTAITYLEITANTAEVSGTGSLNGQPGHTFRMVLQDNGHKAPGKVLELHVDDADWPSGTLKSGTISIPLRSYPF